MARKSFETTLYSLSESAPRPGDRRNDERHLTLFRVGSIILDGHRELCLIKNISAGGMLIRAYCRLSVGDPLSVELKCGDQIAGKVSWIDGDNAGIAFAEPVDVVEILSSESREQKPRMPRVEVRCIASVRQGAKVYGILARDVSQGGVRLETANDLEVGSGIVITLPGLSPLPGTLRWRDGDNYGVTFNRLLSLSELVGWLQAQRQSFQKAS